ncbi:MAG: hypothetical protein LBM96_11650, partial [Methanobrevibacter sp.]|nr:hypothetical protein [Candidatus Methanoflexus mossambicus]
KEINWDEMSVAIPAFFASIFMALSYNISYGIATAFITYCITKIIKKQAKDVHIIIWISSILFILNFIVLAIV